jgi:chromosome segregation ATPase
MLRKIFIGTLLALSSILLAFSVIGIAAIWIYNEQITTTVVSRLEEIDSQLAQIEVTLQASQRELERALRLVDATEKALQQLVSSSGGTGNVFESIQGTLDDRLIPDLKTTRERIDAARATLEDLRSVLEGITSLVPFIDLNSQDKIVADLIVSATSLNADISEIELVAQQASTFVSDTSYLLGGDLTETRDSLQSFLTAIQEYEQKVTGWREQVAQLSDGAPGWIDRASIGLTIFLAWFALSQFGMILHGLSLQYGDNPLWLLRGK